MTKYRVTLYEHGRERVVTVSATSSFDARDRALRLYPFADYIHAEGETK